MASVRKVRRYGWIPDLPDHRDLMYSAPLSIARNLPARYDLSSRFPPAYDQDSLGSCTAQAIAGAFEYSLIKQELASFTPSRLFVYYNERVLMGEDYIHQDSGAYLRDGMKTVAQLGAPPEDLWPYVIERFSERPTADAYRAGLEHQVTSYRRIPRSLAQFRGCLASGFPFVYGFSVYESFEGDEVSTTGVVPMPGPSEALLGGHAVLAVGYDDSQQHFMVRNSWGTDWGTNGYFTMPYAYLLDQNLSDDFWTIRLVEG